VVEAGRANAGDREPTPPAPPELWSRIEADLAPAPRRAVIPRWALAAASVALLVVLGVGVLRFLAPRTTASVALNPLVEGAAGTAVLVEDRAGRALRIDDPDLAQVEGYYEVWLATPAVDGLISLGPYVEGEPQRLPESIDVAAYPVVDISVEPLDGDPGHSGRSVLRGQLPG
jgi:anti-sigma-K factor RskA